MRKRQKFQLPSGTVGHWIANLFVFHDGHGERRRNHAQSEAEHHDGRERTQLEFDEVHRQVGPRLTDNGDEADRWVEHAQDGVTNDVDSRWERVGGRVVVHRCHVQRYTLKQ